MSWWEALGETIGAVIGALLRMIVAVWGALDAVLAAFLDGLARGIGLEDPGLLTWIVLALGVLLVYAAIRRLLRRALITALLLFALGGFFISTVVV